MKHIWVIVIALMLLSGCGTTPKSQSARTQSTANSQVATSSEDEDLPDPLAAHLWARKQVNPNETTPKRSYTQLDTNSPVYSEYHSGKVPQRAQVAAAEPPPVPDAKPQFKREVQVPEKYAGQVPQPSRKVTYQDRTASQPRMVSQRTASQPRTASTNFDHKITNIRIGDHPGKTRIVFDADSPVKASVRTGNNGRVVYLTFDDASWQMQVERTFSNHALLSDYQARSSSEGTVVEIRTKRPVNVSGPTNYPPNSTYNNHRVVIDIAG